MAKPRSLADRFWSKVDRSGGPDACWPWMGYISPVGYGLFYVGEGCPPITAHRQSYSLATGEDITGVLVCHRCDNKPCCNPAHLFAGTHAENMADMVAKGRSTAGERNPSAKLSAADVIAIRRLRSEGLLQREIAARFNVQRHAIGKILRGDRWGSVPSESEQPTLLGAL